MANFFGGNFFKKSASSTSTKSPQMRKTFGGLEPRECSRTRSDTQSLMWDSLCEFNTSSDLDDSTDLFFSRPSLLSPCAEKQNSPIQMHSEKSRPPATTTTSTNKWKTNFLMPHNAAKSSNQSDSKQHPAPSPFSKLNSKPPSSPSTSFRYTSAFGKSPALKSPPTSLEIDLSDRAGVAPNNTSVASPSVRKLMERDDKQQDSFMEPPSSLEVTTIDLDQSEDEERHQEIQHYPVNVPPKAKNSPAVSSHKGSTDDFDESEPLDANGSDKLSFLHIKLKNEAIKLESWKNDMITKLSRTEEKLTEANNLVSSLRKSNLELQMDRENASLKVKDEIEKRLATEQKISGTRDLCEALKTKIDLVKSTCTSTMQTCFKTATVQKTLEAILDKTFQDFQNLSIDLEKSKERNDSLVETQVKLKDDHSKEIERLNTCISRLQNEFEEANSEKSRLTAFVANCEENLKGKITKIRSAYEELEYVLQQTSNGKQSLEAELKKSEFELSQLRSSIKTKESELAELMEKCTRLSGDLSRVYSLLQSSENSCLEKGQRIMTLEMEIERLNDHKVRLKEELLQNNVTHEADLQRKEIELKRLKESLDASASNLNALIREKEELIKLLDEEKVKLRQVKDSAEDELTRLRSREKEISDQNEEQKKQLAEKETEIQMMKSSEGEYTKKLEELKMELEKREAVCNDLQEANKSITQNLTNEMKLRTEVESKLLELQKLEDIKNQEIEQLRGFTTSQKGEIEQLLVKVQNLEFDQSRLNSKNQEMNRCIELKNTQIVRLETRASEAEAEGARRCEEVRKELLAALEQHQLEADQAIRQKEQHIANLQETLSDLQKESGKSSKRIEKKLIDNVAQVEKLREQLKESVQEKKELSKQLTTSKHKMTKLEKELGEKQTVIAEMENKVDDLDSKLASACSEREKLVSQLSTKSAEIERLLRVEAEYEDLKRSIINNSPPRSSQLPKSIEIELQKTPRSPFLSEKFNHMVLMKTPQKTPKSILKQPGSECKRRRVMLISPNKENSTDHGANDTNAGTIRGQSETGDPTATTIVDSDSDILSQSPLNVLSPPPPRTPKAKSTPQPRSANVRKTPGSGAASRGPPTNSRHSSRTTRAKEAMSKDSADARAVTGAANPSSSSSWFDSDETFGMNAEE